MKWLYGALVTLLLCTGAFAQLPPVPNEVTGLKLPTPQLVAYDEGFVSLTAECKGTVKWLVVSSTAKVKYKVNPATPNDIDIAIPPHEATIVVYAIAIVDGQQTEFARTEIAVGGPSPTPTPPTPVPPTPTPLPDVKGPFYLSIVEDPLKRTPAIRQIVENLELFKKLRDKQVTVRTYTPTDPKVTEKKLDVVVQKYGLPLLVLQDSTGKALVIGPLPADLNALYTLITPYIGEIR